MRRDLPRPLYTAILDLGGAFRDIQNRIEAFGRCKFEHLEKRPEKPWIAELLIGARASLSQPSRDTFLKVMQLSMLADDLEVAHVSANFGLMRLVRSLIHDSSDETTYSTKRFELGIGADLWQSGIDFEKQESPDFLLTHNIGFECTSARLRDEKSKADYIAKLRSAVIGKAKKPYANKSTALVVDYTNLFWSLRGRTIAPSRDELADVIRNNGGINFGSVTLVATIFRRMNEHGQQWTNHARHYARFDQSNASPTLIAAVNTVFPIQKRDYIPATDFEILSEA